jgi:glycosyltransferase involved in cell wall biosynthesis
MRERSKILWLCTYSDRDKQGHLKLWRCSHYEIGQWIPNLIQGFLGDDRYELHVVSSEGWMRKGRETWTKNGVTYHCFQSGIPGLGYSFRLPFEAMTRFCFNRQHIKRIVRQVQPDLIHVFGIENPQYASAIFDLDPSIPVLVTIQGFIHRSRAFLKDYATRVRCEYEERLMKSCRHFTGDYDSEKVVRSFNPGVTWAHLYFPVNEALIDKTPPQDKTFDILFAGGLTRAKGFGDFLEVVRLLKADIHSIRAGVVGDAQAYSEAIPFIKRHGLDDNVVWLGRFPDQAGLFMAYRQAKVFLTPTYNDAFASTIRECMLLGTPVVSYKTGGIPYANRDGNENIVIVDQGDVRGMAMQVSALLQNENRRAALGQRALKFAKEEFSLKNNVGVIKNEYERLLSRSCVSMNQVVAER